MTDLKRLNFLSISMSWARSPHYERAGIKKTCSRKLTTRVASQALTRQTDGSGSIAVNRCQSCEWRHLLEAPTLATVFRGPPIKVFWSSPYPPDRQIEMFLLLWLSPFRTARRIFVSVHGVARSRGRAQHYPQPGQSILCCMAVVAVATYIHTYIDIYILYIYIHIYIWTETLIAVAVPVALITATISPQYH